MSGKARLRVEEPIGIVYRKYRYNAKKRGLVFDLTPEQLSFLIKQDCWFCGKKARYSKSRTTPSRSRGGSLRYNGIDRISNKRGYVLSNCRPSCRDCNYARGSLTTSAFFALIRRICAKHSNPND